MSLLDRGPDQQPCNVYLEVTTTDADGNTITKASTTPTPTTARFQIQNQSGTSSRRAESNDEGYFTEKVYSVRFTRSFEAAHGPLGSQAIIGWGLDSKGREAKYEIFGDVLEYTSSRRTKHRTYTIRRY